MQSLAVSCQFEIAAPDEAALLIRADRALPVNRTGGQTRIVLLIVEQGLEFDLPGAQRAATIRPDRRSRFAATATAARL